MGVVGEVDYRIEIDSGKVKTYHINMLKRYHHRDGSNPSKIKDDDGVHEQKQVHQTASVACVLEDEVEVEDSAVNDAALLSTYNLKQKETFEDVVVNEELDEEKKTEVNKLLKEYKQIFSDVPTKTNLIEHKVELTDSNPIKHKSYPIPYKMQEIIDKEIEDMLAMGVIERSEAPYASPLVLVKKPDQSYRVCVNFKELNKITVFDPEPMMSADEIFPKLSGSQYYSTFDFCKGYWAIPMEKKSKDYTTFVTSRGLMRFKVMPFGMVNSGSTYNRMVRKLLYGSQNLESYVDDILGHTTDWENHMRMLKDFFERVKHANLSLKPSKCKIGSLRQSIGIITVMFCLVTFIVHLSSSVDDSRKLLLVVCKSASAADLSCPVVKV